MRSVKTIYKITDICDQCGKVEITENMNNDKGSFYRKILIIDGVIVAKNSLLWDMIQKLGVIDRTYDVCDDCFNKLYKQINGIVDSTLKEINENFGKDKDGDLVTYKKTENGRVIVDDVAQKFDIPATSCGIIDKS